MSQPASSAPAAAPASAAPTTLTLDRVERGRVVRIVEIDAAGDAAIARRLDDLGLRSGVEITVVRRAPLGDPTLFELHGYQLCLRRSESARVRVADNSGRGRPAPAGSGGSGIGPGRA